MDGLEGLAHFGLPSSDCFRMTHAIQPSLAVSAALRRWLMATYLVGAAGLGLELLLMEHVEGVTQQLPLWLIGASLLTLGMLPLRRRAVVGVFRVLMVLLALCGILGVYLHFDGKAEFERELEPTLAGWALVWECLHGPTVPPVLAPGALVMLAMLGIACFHQHPLASVSSEESTNQPTGKP